MDGTAVRRRAPSRHVGTLPGRRAVRAADIEPLFAREASRGIVASS